MPEVDEVTINIQAHSPHHKGFNPNYSDGLVSFDHWFRSCLDSRKDSDASMQIRFEAQKSRLNKRTS